MALERWMATADGRARLLADVNAQRVITAVTVEYDPGLPGTVSARIVAPPSVDQTITLVADGQQVVKRQTFSIPTPRRWNFDGPMPAGYAINLMWMPPIVVEVPPPPDPVR